MEANDAGSAPAIKRSTVVKVLHWGDNPPSVVCLCSPAKYRTNAISAYRALTLSGSIVLMPAQFGPSDSGIINGETKKNVDALQLRMVEMCDIVYVVSPNGYMDASMQAVISYAESIGRAIKYLTA